MDALSGDAGARAVLLLQPLVDGVWPPATAVVVVDGSQASGAQGRSVRAAGWGPGREERPPACAWSPPSWRQAALQPLPLDAPKMHRPAAALCAEVVPVTLRLQRGAGGGDVAAAVPLWCGSTGLGRWPPAAVPRARVFDVWPRGKRVDAGLGVAAVAAAAAAAVVCPYWQRVWRPPRVCIRRACHVRTNSALTTSRS